MTAISGGDATVERELIALLVDEAATLYARVRDEAASLPEYAHALKGMAGNVGAVRLEAAAKALEEAIRSDQGAIERELIAIDDALAELRRLSR
ncbi:MAG TPA: Hpt domain-containing protein [Candidatus Elarobacter sp.]